MSPDGEASQDHSGIDLLDLDYDDFGDEDLMELINLYDYQMTPADREYLLQQNREQLISTLQAKLIEREKAKPQPFGVHSQNQQSSASQK